MCWHKGDHKYSNNLKSVLYENGEQTLITPPEAATLTQCLPRLFQGPNGSHNRCPALCVDHHRARPVYGIVQTTEIVGLERNHYFWGVARQASERKIDLTSQQVCSVHRGFTLDPMDSQPPNIKDEHQLISLTRQS